MRYYARNPIIKEILCSPIMQEKGNIDLGAFCFHVKKVGQVDISVVLQFL